MADLRYNLCSEDDLICFFKDTFHLNIDKQRLIKPDKALMLEVLNKFVEYLRLDVSQIDLGACHGFCNLAPLENFYRTANLVRAFKTLLSQTNLIDFELSDVITPKRKRNQKIFSQLLGIFINFLELENKWNSSYEDKFQQLPMQREAAEHKVNYLREQVEHHSLDLNRLKQANMESKDEIQTIIERITQIKHEESSLMTEKNELKHAITEISAQLGELELAKINLKTELDMLQKQIVVSPEKFFEALQEKEDELKQVRSEKNTLHVKVSEMKNFLDSLHLHFEKLDSLDSYLDECEQICEKEVATSCQIEQIAKQRKVLLEHMEGMRHELQNLSTTHSVLTKEIQQLHNAHKVDVKPILTAQNRLKNIHEAKKNELNNTKNAKVNFEALDEIKHKNKELMRSLEENYLKVEAKYAQAIEKFVNSKGI